MRNVAEGMRHSIVNAVGNANSERKANAKLRQIFADSKTREVIENGVFEAAFALHHVLITC